MASGRARIVPELQQRAGQLAVELRHSVRRPTARWRMVPDFLIIGAQRAGTTSLFHYLQRHPSVMQSSIKEVHYFDGSYNRGRRWYLSHFPLRRATSGGRITGEATPYYLFHPTVPTRVAVDFPDVKLIAILRDP